jgi:muramoyltetrapeptide carboxypeptidase
MQKSWQPLKKNDKVRLIAPGAGSPITAEPSSNWQDLEKCCALLRSWQLEPVFSPLIFGDNKSYYNFANTDEHRYNDFVDAFNSDAAAVWSFRGGYGSDRIIRDAIKNKILFHDPKLFIGFSDVTNIHSYLNGHCHITSLHALSARQLALDLVDKIDIETTRKLMFGEQDQINLTLTPLNKSAMKKNEIHSRMSGGNLTIVQSSLGTPWQTPNQKTILLLEDVGEIPYRIARILQQFLASEFLQSTLAIILGDFTPEENVELALEEFANQTEIPVLRCHGIGHGRGNHPIPLGTAATLSLGKTAEIVIAAR